MKSTIWLVLIPLTLLLVACSSEPFDRAYIAAGDGSREVDLVADEQFTPTEDFNVVVKLNRRNDPVDLLARFIDPNGDLLEEITATADTEIGTVVLGVDYQSRSDQVNQWLRGRYRVEVFVDGEQVETLFFRVD